MAGERTTQGEESLVNVVAAVIPKLEPSIFVKPTLRPLDYPPVFSQSAAVLGVAPRQNRLDASLAKFLAMRFGIVGPVPSNASGR